MRVTGKIQRVWCLDSPPTRDKACGEEKTAMTQLESLSRPYIFSEAWVLGVSDALIQLVADALGQLRVWMKIRYRVRG